MISPILCGVAALFACTVSGLTGFGDGILFHVIMAIADSLGISTPNIPERVTLILIFVVMNYPVFVYYAKPLLRSVYPFGLFLACFSLPMVVLGAFVLFSGDFGILEYMVGSLFVGFSVIRLSIDIYTDVIKRPSKENTVMEVISRSFSQEWVDDSPIKWPSYKGSQLKLEQSEEVVQSTSAQTTYSEDINKVELLEQEGLDPPTYLNRNNEVPMRIENLSLLGRFWVYIESYPRLSKYSNKTAACILVITGLAVGFLASTMGIGGPPQMIAFSILSLQKDTIRAVNVAYSSVELPLRVIMFTTSPGNVFDLRTEWRAYLATVIGGWCGVFLGTRLRAYVSTTWILRMLYLLIYIGAVILLHGLEDSSVGIPMVLFAFFWLSCLVYVYIKGIPCRKTG